MELESLRQICLALPAVTEDVKWGNNLCFSVGGKMFFMSNLEPPFSHSFKVKDEEFEELCNRDGFLPAPYLARAHWVLITKPGVLHRNEWTAYIKQSYHLVYSRLSKKERKALGI